MDTRMGKKAILEMEAEVEDHLYVHYKEPTARLHFHSAVEMIFMDKGTTNVFLNGESFVLHPGEACFVDAFSLHGYTVESRDCRAYTVVGAKKWWDRVFDMKGGRIPPTVFPYDDEELLKMLLKIYRRTDALSEERKYVYRGIVALLLGDVSQRISFVERKERKDTLLICNVLRFADSHIAEDLSVGRIAREFGYSTDHIARVLKAYLQTSWADYVNTIRIRKAEELLQRDGGRTVLDVAMECGFRSAATFYRAWSAVFGTTPRR